MNKKSAKPVAQEDAMGCGIACVAFVCGTSYGRTRKYFDKPCNAWSAGYWCKDIVHAFARVGKIYAWRRLRRRTAYPEGSIVFIARSKRYRMGHYLARVGRDWMDPWMNFPSIKNVRAGFRRRLPGRAAYLIYPKSARALK